ncbi:MAG: serpin family protein [Ruminococcaceae bacterium]|nr:serpin family protein [Oscillospiraceae bacterium]
MNEKSSEKLYHGITHIDDELVEAAQAKAAPRRRPWVKWCVMAACLCLVAAGAFALSQPHGSPADNTDRPVNENVPTPDDNRGDPNSLPTSNLSAFSVAEAVYPERVTFPLEENYVNANGEWDYDTWSADYNTWYEADEARRQQAAGYAGTLDSFCADSVRQFLSGAGTENRVYSPVNVYLAMAMVAEVTDGQSRQQILDLLGADSIETLRARAAAVWDANYQDDGATKLLLANSLWLSESVGYVPETMQALAEHYFASAYRGKMGSAEYTQALRDWLNAQTGGLLQEQAQNVEPTPDTILALASTLYLKAGWTDEFYEAATAPDVFHGPEGDVTCDFMHGVAEDGQLYRGDGFTAVCKHLSSGGAMWFLLPDEGSSPDKLLAGGQAVSFLLADKNSWADQDHYIVHLNMPKFDVDSDMELAEGMKVLGVIDAFDSDVSDFTPLTTEVDELYISRIQHAARVKVDEEGVEAAAFTVVSVEANGIDLSDEVDFTLDRPFLFAVTGEENALLFTGVVNQP